MNAKSWYKIGNVGKRLDLCFLWLTICPVLPSNWFSDVSVHLDYLGSLIKYKSLT